MEANEHLDASDSSLLFKKKFKNSLKSMAKLIGAAANLPCTFDSRTATLWLLMRQYLQSTESCQ